MRRQLIVVLVIGILLGVAVGVAAQGLTLTPASRYMGWQDSTRTLYVIAVLDAFLFAARIPEVPPRVASCLSEKLSHLTLDQFRGMVDQWLLIHAESRAYGMPQLIAIAMLQACGL